MVCDLNRILDCGVKKDVCECNNMTSQDYIIWRKFEHRYNDLFDMSIKHTNNSLDTYLGVRNIDYRSYHKIRTYEYWEKEFNKLCYKSQNITWNKIIQDMYIDLGEEKFLHNYMINISPNWKLEEGQKPTKLMISLLNTVVEGYLKESDRWDSAEYVLENGGEGNFLHSHIVAKPNKNILKSIDTHMNKGNHSVQLRKRWDKECRKNPELEGYVGCLKGKYSIQKIVLRNPELIDDKRKYLNEEDKPEGHTNIPQKYLNIKRKWARL